MTLIHKQDGLLIFQDDHHLAFLRIGAGANGTDIIEYVPFPNKVVTLRKGVTQGKTTEGELLYLHYPTDKIETIGEASKKK
jgi:hypothetical protein